MLGYVLNLITVRHPTTTHVSISIRAMNNLWIASIVVSGSLGVHRIDHAQEPASSFSVRVGMTACGKPPLRREDRKMMSRVMTAMMVMLEDDDDGSDGIRS